MSNQKFEVDFSNPQNKVHFIRAGAGAGKTTTLIQNCISFVQQFKLIHHRFPKIIITTFTKKATQEIKERLMLEALKTKDDELFQYFNKKSFVQIGTIHNVLNLFLRQNTEALGLPADISIVNEFRIYFRLKKFIKQIFEKKSEYHLLLDHYKFDQLLRLLIKASEVKMNDPRLKPVELAFLQDISATERQRLTKLISEFIDATTAHSTRWQSQIDFLQNVKSAINEQNYDNLLKAYENKPRKYTLSRTRPEIDLELDAQISLIFKEPCLSPLSLDVNIERVHQVHSAFESLLNEVVDFLMKSRQMTGEITISDLELLTKQAMLADSQSMKRFAAQYDYIMVDEYQDTSPLQVSILNELMADKFQFIVGDPQQSIYLFRGARSEVFAQKEQQVNSLGYPTVQKMQNFRSQPRLMQFMNDFFKKYSSDFLPMIPKSHDFQPRTLPEATFVTALNHRYDAICDHILFLHSNGLAFSEITVLFKKNSEILQFAKYAQKLNIPVQIQISKGFEDKAEIGDLLSLLRFLVNPYDSHNLIRLLRSPWFKTTDQDIINLRQADSINSLWSQMAKGQNQDYQFLKSLEKCYLEKGVSEALIYFLKNSIFLQSSLYLDPTTLREANIWKLIDTISRRESRSDFNLSEFINYELTQFDADLSSSDGEGLPIVATNRVSLMTVHGSKGLQFKNVIIDGFNESVRNTGTSVFEYDEVDQKYCLKIKLLESETLESTLWSDQNHDKFLNRARQENDRVLYVAMTRAIETVALVREASKTVPKNSWLEKTLWNKDIYQSDQYSVEFKDVDKPPQAIDSMYQFKEKGIKPLTMKNENVISAGVTHLLTQDLVIDLPDASEKSDALVKPDVQKLSEKTVLAFNKSQKGTDLHQYFESLKFNTVEEVSQKLPPDDRKALLWLMSQNQIPLRELFDQGHVEWGFGLKVKKDDGFMLVQGQIDAWGVIGQDLYILDYKTGSTKYLNKAFDQLQAYAGCLKQMGLVQTNQKICLAVVYPFEQHIEIKEIFANQLQLELTL